MTAAELLAALNTLGTEYDNALVYYSSAPGVSIWVTNYQLLPELNPLQWVIHSTFPVGNPWTVSDFRSKLLAALPYAGGVPVYIPTPRGLGEVTSIRAFVYTDEWGVREPRVALNADGRSPPPPPPPPIPFDRRKQRTAPPAWPNIPTADP